MKSAHRIFTARAQLFSALGIAALAACSVQGGETGAESTSSTTSALGTCPAGQIANSAGVCGPCSLYETATATTFGIELALAEADVANATYAITNNVGALTIAKTNLASMGFAQPSPSAVSIAAITGSFSVLGVSIDYTAYPTIPTMSLTWGAWDVLANSVQIPATLSGVIDLKVETSVATVTPTVTFTNLPVSISFGAGSNGDATITASQVVLPALGQYTSVSGCGEWGWCTGLVNGQIETAIQSYLPSAFASTFWGALNGAGGASPFWLSVMNGIANQKQATGLLTDPAGYTLPVVGSSSAAGAVSQWTCDNIQSFTNGSVTAGFTGKDICFVDCTPKTQAEVCGPLVCGTLTDGCGDTVTCPAACPTGEVCNTVANTCEFPAVCPVCPAGESCSISNGHGVCVKEKICPVLTHSCNGVCVGGTGTACPG